MRTLVLLSILLVSIGCGEHPQVPIPTKNPSIMPQDKSMDWDDPRDPVAITVPEIVAGRTSVLLVTHDSGHGGWQFMDGQDVNQRKPAIIPKETLLRLDPTLAELKDLPAGWRAYRESSDAPWIREKNHNPD